jgi:hypothetical protein
MYGLTDLARLPRLLDKTHGHTESVPSSGCDPVAFPGESTDGLRGGRHMEDRAVPSNQASPLLQTLATVAVR